MPLARLLERDRSGHRRHDPPGLRRITHQRRERVARDVPPSLARLSPVGRPSSLVVEKRRGVPFRTLITSPGSSSNSCGRRGMASRSGAGPCLRRRRCIVLTAPVSKPIRCAAASIVGRRMRIPFPKVGSMMLPKTPSASIKLARATASRQPSPASTLPLICRPRISSRQLQATFKVPDSAAWIEPPFQEKAVCGLAIINHKMAATAVKAGIPKANQRQKIR